ncbi:MAG: SURF1 family cytochrome oxidase biogenesis protein, partial [Pseudomonadota bacterium]|nr:SURF1 family cytochrome oxidase biogenesis protein [Pseudomonadota bacterium]
SSMMASADLPQLQPYYILAANKTDGGLPVGHQWRIDIRNNHLQYAITWFALAFGLLVVYLLYHRRPTDSSDEI